MTRKEYELIAQAMRGCRISIANGYPPAMTDREREIDMQRIAVHRAACHALAEALAADNPRFRRMQFLEACKCAI